MNRLQDKVAIITGADGGICHKASEFFCQEGAKVVMVDKDPHVEEKCAAIVAAGGDAIAITADVSIKENWEKILQATLDKYGRVDCVVNGAAEFCYSGDWNAPPDMEEWDRVLNTNLKSMLYSYQVVLQYMLDHDIHGNFINFASSTALSYMGSGCQAYPMSKAAILISTKDMVTNNAKKGIRFNCIAPNLVQVPKQNHLYENEAMAGWFRSIMPSGEWGHPEDCAHCMVWLASDEAKFISGVCIPVDGGWSPCH